MGFLLSFDLPWSCEPTGPWDVIGREKWGTGAAAMSEVWAMPQFFPLGILISLTSFGLEEESLENISSLCFSLRWDRVGSLRGGI